MAEVAAPVVVDAGGADGGATAAPSGVQTRATGVAVALAVVTRRSALVAVR